MTVIVPKIDTKKSLEAATAEYQRQLQNADEALAYLQKDRGISSEALEYFRLGYVRDPQPGHESFRGRISFPYITPGGIVSVRFRYLGDHGDRSKFLYVTGDSPRPYNCGSLRGSSTVFVCEGETDTIAAWQAGLPAIGFPGAETWMAKDKVSGVPLGMIWSRILWNRHVTILADNDDQGAGKEFAQDIYRFLGGCDIIMMDSGHDVSTYVLDHGGQALRKKVGYE